MTPTSFIETARDGHVATVTLARAERRNAVTQEMMSELERVARSFADDAETRAVIVRAEGDDFSVGADLQQPRFAAARERGDQPPLVLRRRQLELGALLMRSLQEIHQPTICAIQGVATGAGACIASACDFRVAADDARIGYGEVKLGINLMWNAVPVCVHLVGPSRAKQLILTGRLFEAGTLERWGFVDEVVAPENLGAAARRWADEYAALPPIAVQMIKRSIHHVTSALDRAILHMDADQWLLAAGTDDFREAVTAFFEKRDPQFRGE